MSDPSRPPDRSRLSAAETALTIVSITAVVVLTVLVLEAFAVSGG